MKRKIALKKKIGSFPIASFPLASYFAHDRVYMSMLLSIRYEKKDSSKSCPTLAIPWIVACQAPLSMRFSRQEYWSARPFPSPGELPGLGTAPRPPALQADTFPTELPGKKPQFIIKQTWHCLTPSPGKTFFLSHPCWLEAASCLTGPLLLTLLPLILEAVKSPPSGCSLTGTHQMPWGARG